MAGWVWGWVDGREGDGEGEVKDVDVMLKEAKSLSSSGPDELEAQNFM
jgi:hypothetical protein